MKLFFFVTFPFLCFAISPEEEAVKRLEGHLTLEDFYTASVEGEKEFEKFPNSEKIFSSYLLALFENGEEPKALKLAQKYFQEKHPENRQFLEKLSWVILKKGSLSNSYPNRLTALVGAYLSRDCRGVLFFLKMMRDSNAILRSYAIKLCCQYQDAILKDEILRLFKEEKNWQVRLEIISAIGKLKENRCQESLEKILQDPRSMHEEKALAMNALVEMSEKVNEKHIISLLNSKRSYLRQLGCELALFFEVKEVKNSVLELIKDPIASVRICALNALAFFYKDQIPKEKSIQYFESLINDNDPNIVITAGWAALLIDPSLGKTILKPYLFHEKKELRRLAAAAVSYAGASGTDLALEVMEKSKDVTVLLNLSIGLIGQRKAIKQCCDVIYNFLILEKSLWMWENDHKTIFRVLSPSSVGHTELFPSYPQAVDQMMRIELLSLLAILQDPRALNAAKALLKEKDWQVKGPLALMLMKEGEEEGINLLSLLLKDPDPNIQIQAALILAILAKDESTVFLLHSFYPKASYEKKIDILDALGHIGSCESIEFLTQALFDPSQKIRIVAASSLIRCINH